MSTSCAAIRTPIPRWVPPLLLGLAGLPYLVGLGRSSLWDANESFYAETPREMLEAGDYLAPRFNYQVRAQKPPLVYWAVLGSYRLLGVSELGVRVPGALAALGTLAFTFGIARTLGSPLSGLVAVALVATTPRVFVLARRLPIDILLLLWLTGSAYCLARIARGRSGPGTRLLLYTLLALGFLTKGPVAWLIPGAAYVGYGLLSGRFRPRELRPLQGAAVVALLVLPWYVLIYRAHGWTYIADFFLRDNLGRFAAESFGPARGPLYYLPTYLADFFPWSVLSIPALYAVWSDRRRLRDQPALLLPLVWCAVVFAVFSLARNKQEYYIAPLYPMMAALLAIAFERALVGEPGAAPRSDPWAWSLFAVSLVLFGIGMCAFVVLRALVPDLPMVLQVLPWAGLAAASAAVAGCVVRRRLAGAALVLGSACWLMFVLVAGVYLRAVEPYRPVKEMCRSIEALAAPRDEVGYYRATLPSMAFYLRRPIFEEFDADAMVRRFGAGARVYCILTEADYNYFVGSRDLILYVLDRRVRLLTQLRALVDRESWAGQELVLVCNRPMNESGAREGREIP
jgi:4-amino-4-deoxy-L-arabinose transferase-like glycosyltransferase